MHISDYDYDLPKELIAQTPLPERDASRLLVVDRARGSIEHREFGELPELLRAGDRVVANDTRVIPARLLGKREGGAGEIELLLLTPIRGRENRPTFHAFARPARKVTVGTPLFMGDSGARVDVVGELDEKTRIVEFAPGFAIHEFLIREGHVPLPPYIQRPDTLEDRERYQTVFAARPGAVAAPTAGLHFTQEILDRLRRRAVDFSTITLHVGAGTFVPTVSHDPRDHVMEREYYRIGTEAAEEIGSTRAAAGRVVAVGTTVVRTLETAEVHVLGSDRWHVRPGDGWTEKYIYPPYEFHVVDAMVTNFHLPRSTLLILVCAFGGLELVRRAYREAVNARYRFYSYGDAMLIV